MLVADVQLDPTARTLLTSALEFVEQRHHVRVRDAGATIVGERAALDRLRRERADVMVYGAADKDTSGMAAVDATGAIKFTPEEYPRDPSHKLFARDVAQAVELLVALVDQRDGRTVAGMRRLHELVRFSFDRSRSGDDDRLRAQAQEVAYWGYRQLCDACASAGGATRMLSLIDQLAGEGKSNGPLLIVRGELLLERNHPGDAREAEAALEGALRGQDAYERAHLVLGDLYFLRFSASRVCDALAEYRLYEAWTARAERQQRPAPGDEEWTKRMREAEARAHAGGGCG